MFLLIGTRAVAAVMFMVTFVCGRCGALANQRIVREQQKVTLFFIPLFSLSSTWLIECDHCGQATALTRRQADHSLQWAAAHGLAAA